LVILFDLRGWSLYIKGMKKAEKKKEELVTRSGQREITGIVLIMFGLMLLLGILSYDPMDIPSLNNQPESHNWIGPVGASVAHLFFVWFGIATYLVPFGVLWIGGATVWRSGRKIYPRMFWLMLFLFCLAGLINLEGDFWYDTTNNLNIATSGGMIGYVLAEKSIGSWFGTAGAAIIFVSFFVVASIKLFNIHPIEVGKLIWRLLAALKTEPPTPEEVASISKPQPKKPRKKKKTKEKKESNQEELSIHQILKANEKAQKKVSTPSKQPAPVAAKQPTPVSPSAPSPQEKYVLPSIDLLDPVVPQGKGMTATEIADTAQILQNTLEEFGVEAKVTGVQQGPVVTCYEILPAAGVRVERIKSLQDNIALKMRAESIRIQAPIPGKGVCGVEIPNTTRLSVFFRDLISSPTFQKSEQALPLILGKDVNGMDMILDLAKMPHLLIAGATGAGKSVCMNSILTGLLMKHSPEDLSLILVDPKTVEFHQYNDLPHLVAPVITDAKKVALGLKWAIDEMERRFKWFRQAGVRDLPAFNARIIQKQEELFNEEELAVVEDKKDEIPEKLPYIVIVIDELADLMAVAQSEIEAGIARLAAKSRAAGIHLILATQRPDVKVITGTIKANFPVRIAFKVSQKVDSRTILDRMGADALLGRGDMLVLPQGSDKLIRSQGAFTSDGEIERVTNFCKAQRQPAFIQEIHEKLDKPVSDIPDIDTGADDEMLQRAIEVIRQTKRASTSSLQRRLRIGYSRAARLMDLLEERGIIGPPPDGPGPREILIDLDGQIPQNEGVEEHATE